MEDKKTYKNVMVCQVTDDHLPDGKRYLEYLGEANEVHIITDSKRVSVAGKVINEFSVCNIILYDFLYEQKYFDLEGEFNILLADKEHSKELFSKNGVSISLKGKSKDDIIPQVIITKRNF